MRIVQVCMMRALNDDVSKVANDFVPPLNHICIEGPRPSVGEGQMQHRTRDLAEKYQRVTLRYSIEGIFAKSRVVLEHIATLEDDGGASD